jgi:hypothetical protein
MPKLERDHARWQVGDANDLIANSFAFSSVSVDNTWGLGAGIGTYFGGGVRGDLTYEWRASEWRASTDVHATGVAVADFELDTQVLLANLYWDCRRALHALYRHRRRRRLPLGRQRHRHAHLWWHL